MAEVATKKSMNVVSSKTSEVCGVVQSNNGLIQLTDNLTASNKQLISLCESNDDEDDLILTNNTRNELDTDDKSLQELIESELALRICTAGSAPGEGTGVAVDAERDGVGVDRKETIDAPEPDTDTELRTDLETETVKRIVLDGPRDQLDVNAEFIAAEAEHSALIEKPYSYRNGHVSPDARIVEDARTETRSEPEPEEPEPQPEAEPVLEEAEAKVETEQASAAFRDEREERVFDEQPEVGSAVAIEETKTREIDRPPRDPSSDDGNTVPRKIEDTEDPCPNYSPASADRLGQVAVAGMTQESFVACYEAEQDHRLTSKPVAYADKYQEEREIRDLLILEPGSAENLHQDTAACTRDSDPSKSRILEDDDDTWPEHMDAEGQGGQTGQFSDNFDQSLCEDNEPSAVEEDAKDEGGNAMIDDPFELDTERGKESETEEEAGSGTGAITGTGPGPGVEQRLALEEESRISGLAKDLDASWVARNVPAEPEAERETERANGSQARNRLEDAALCRSDSSNEMASTQEFIDTERRVLNEEIAAPDSRRRNSPVEVEEEEDEDEEEAAGKEEGNDNADEQNPITESSSELSVSEPTFIEKTELLITESTVKIVSETRFHESGTDAAEPLDDEAEQLRRARAPLATPDDETSDISNTCDSESREESVTTSTTVVSSPAKGTTKTKKKKIEGVAGNDASPNLTPRTKKTKKSKKSELEKENISVNCNSQEEASMHPAPRPTNPETIDFSDEDDLSNVNVKSLTQTYVSEATRNEQDRCAKEKIATGVSIKQLCRSFGDISNMSDGDQTAYGKPNHAMDTDEKARSLGDLRLCEKGYSKFSKDALVFTGVSVKALKSSFNKFDALSKKTVLHVRSVDAAKVQQQLNAVGQNGDTNPNCRSCGKVVFQMEQTKAEGLVWHKNCFRCVQCSKQLNVDNYESHESTLYCKPHFKELFQPKPVEESDQPVRPRKPELIIRENEPKELPPDVVRASDKPDLGLEELSSLNVKSRFQVFEKAAGTEANEIERSPSQIAVKRSPSILSKLAKFQAKGMDIGVADESLNGIPYEESSESEEEEETEETEEVDSEIVKAKRATRERPISFTKMDDIKNRWESTSQQGRREVQREARKEEIAGIRSRLFMGKQGKMKEMYQQAVAGSERVTKINAAEEIQHSTHARSIKERFERGEPIAASDDETDGKPKPEKADEEVIAAGISRKSRSLFLELDASAAKTGRPVTPVNPKTPAEAPRRARDAFMGRQVSEDVVRSTDTTEEVRVETSDISNKFKFFESYKEPEKERKQFRITPPRDGQVKMDSPEREIYRDPGVVRADDRVDEVVHTDTARKMLSIFRQMEENACKKEVPNGPKPLKRFTPPPEDKYAKPAASDSEADEDEEGEESEAEDSGEERDPNYVRASDKVEDEFLKQAQNAARAKTLCAKFEHWEETDAKTTTSSGQHIAEMEIAQNAGDQQSTESASSLRARFESLGSQPTESPRTAKVKVNRFVEIQASCTDVCESCEKKVYPLEKVETNNKIFHKQCFRCLQCNCVLRMDTFTLNNGKLYCIPHFKQLFITRGNYDEGFGVDPHKNKWSSVGSSNPTSPSPIAVHSNGDL